MQLFSRLALASLFAAALLDARTSRAQSRRARAPLVEQPPSPVSLSVQMRPGTLFWSFSLSNTSDRPVEIAADRNLLSVEVTAPAPVIDPSMDARARRRLAARAPKPATCRSALFHANTDETARAQLGAGQSYSEGFDLRSLCGARFPRALVAGASLVFTYGRRGNRPSFARAVVFIDGPAPIEELRAPALTVPPSATQFPPSPPRDDASERGAVSIRVPTTISADRAAGLAFRVALRARGMAPLRAFYRPSMLSIEVRTPRGRLLRCSDAPLGYVGLPDYLRSITRSGGPSATLSIGLLCDRSMLGEAGVYLARVVFESDVEPVTSRQASFRGRVASPWIWAVVRRGSPAERYAPMPVEDPFAALSAPPAADSRR